MVASQSTVPCPVEPAHIDLIRRYCPGLVVHTHAEIAAHLQPDAQGCWPWGGYVNRAGYGVVRLEPTSYGYKEPCHVHRYMYDILVAPLPPGLHIHHRCHVRDCWHPLHLEAVTPKEHSARHR
jgi:HNH endonuclease